MKSFIFILSFLISLSSFANGGVPSTSNQVGKINAAYLQMIDGEIAQTESNYEKFLTEVIEAPTQPQSPSEGQVLSEIRRLVEIEVQDVKQMRNDLRYYDEIVDKDVNSIYKKLKLINELLEEAYL